MTGSLTAAMATHAGMNIENDRICFGTEVKFVKQDLGAHVGRFCTQWITIFSYK